MGRIKTPFRVGSSIRLRSVNPASLRVRVITSKVYRSSRTVHHKSTSLNCPIVLNRRNSKVIRGIKDRIGGFGPNSRIVLSFCSSKAYSGYLGNIPARYHDCTGCGLSNIETSNSSRFARGNGRISSVFGRSSFAAAAIISRHGTMGISSGLSLHGLKPLKYKCIANSNAMFGALGPGPNSAVTIFKAKTINLTTVVTNEVSKYVGIVTISVIPRELRLTGRLNTARTVGDGRRSPIRGVGRLANNCNIS